MKKILAMLLTVAMLLSLVLVATVSVAAEEENAGMWTTMGNAAQYEENFFDDMKSIPGYEYSEDGFAMTAADWSTSTPFATLQSKEKVNIKQGVFMEVRVDAYSYDASDKWFNFNIWDSVNLDPGNGEDTYGNGVQTLLRPNATGPVADDPETEAIEGGAVSSVAWYIEAFKSAGGATAIEAANRTTVDDEGTLKDVFTLEISWNAEGNTYVVTINKSAAPETVITYMNEHFADGYAYLGFTMHNSKLGGTAAATVTKFGVNAATATVPYGTDSKEAENFDNSVADIADPNTVEAGKPAIFMTGDRNTSDTKNIPSSSTGSKVEVTPEGTLKITAVNANSDFGTIRIDNDVSYDVKDFPILLCVTKNWCTCKMEAHADCLALEAMNAYVLIGDDKAPAPNNKYSGDLDMCYDPVIIGEDNYLYFWADLSTLEKEGRFNGVRFDAMACDLVTDGFNEFEMLWAGLFRTEEEAEEYVLDYLDALAGNDPGEDDTTEPTGDDTTEPVGGDTTEPVGGDTTEADTTKETEADTTKETEADTSKETEADTSKETEADTTKETEADTTKEVETTKEAETNKAEGNDAGDAKEEGGCGSFVGFGAMAVVAVAAVAGMVSFKKKED